ncbi:Gfo/Idh/MocA family oxidoreductase [Marinilongibacter aquaticus]|uniref:Gfo/Idh/MocA family protein n=1 Tax=Marinilongibacter aquaticus TaxID=2975157 RepID=UPI0021BD3F3D|nr:Gfo/Idh/MocA family oxidoreductase [Marinilongibacter aquaticus]UBM57379.1 Gfo/Idh/MocA family oxidoreductase [Marinilongibacter aquaticus]
MGKTINWGIIGIGKIAEKFAEDLATVKDAKLLAVASTSKERAESFAQKHKAKFAFDSYEQIFSAPGLDVVYIATPHSKHFKCTQLCLENKTAVLCEKPFAMNEDEVQKMIDLAKAQNTFLMEALWTRFMPNIKKVLELIEEGAIGQVKTLHADFGFIPPYFPERRVLNPYFGGGAFLDIGIYPAFLSLLILGYPSSISATHTKGPTGVDETTTFFYKYDDRATASLNCTFAAHTQTEARIYGDKGHILMPTRFHDSQEITLVPDEGEPVTYQFPRKTRGYNYEIEEVNRCLQSGLKESTLWPLKDSLRLIHLLDKTRERAGIRYEVDKTKN